MSHSVRDDDGKCPWWHDRLSLSPPHLAPWYQPPAASARASTGPTTPIDRNLANQVGSDHFSWLWQKTGPVSNIHYRLAINLYLYYCACRVQRRMIGSRLDRPSYYKHYYHIFLYYSQIPVVISTSKICILSVRHINIDLPTKKLKHNNKTRNNFTSVCSKIVDPKIHVNILF